VSLEISITQNVPLSSQHCNWKNKRGIRYWLLEFDYWNCTLRTPLEQSQYTGEQSEEHFCRNVGMVACSSLIFVLKFRYNLSLNAFICHLETANLIFNYQSFLFRY